MRINTVCWLLLILLTITGVTVSGTDHGSNAAAIILMAALIKSGLVGWRFMELHTAHGLWKAGFLMLITGLVGLIYGLA
jgi:hypothetical protein